MSRFKGAVGLSCGPFDSFDREKVILDVVRELWSRPKLENYEKSMKIHKSSLENVLVEEENFRYANALKLVDTDKSLQVLVNSLCFMNERMKKLSNPSQQHAGRKPENRLQPEAATVPAKRLYSDVVQGNNKTKSDPGKPEKVASTATTSFVSLDTSTASSTTSGLMGGESLGEPEAEDKKAKCTYSDVVNGNGSDGTGNLVFLNEFGTERNFQNCYAPVQYLPQGYRFQVPQRVPAPVGGPTPWLVPPYHRPNVYGNFLGQILVPQMPTKHRWMPAKNPASFQAAPAPFPTTGKKKTGSRFGGRKKAAAKGKGRKGGREEVEVEDEEEEEEEEEEVVIPVGFSASEELERIALREYQSSEEIFFREIERQAEEQYDGNPENSPRPPIRATLGGLAIRCCFLLRFIDSFVSTFSISRIRQKLD